MASLDEQIMTIIAKAIDESIEDVTSKRWLEHVGKDLLDRVRVRTKVGRGVDEHEEKTKKLKPLLKETKTRRKRLRKKDQLDTTTKPAKSNFTRSGDTLNSMKHKTRKGQIELIIPGNRNVEKVKENEKQGRTFFKFSKQDVKFVVKEIDSGIEKRIVRNINKIK